MPATASYQAGIETTGAQLSYGIESTWGTLPAVQFQGIRFTSESLSMSKTRNRPAEIPPGAVYEVAQAVTTQVQAGGSISFALSWGTFDDLISSAINNDWQTAQVIAGVAADITITAGSPATLSSTTSNKFTNIAAGQFVRFLGFTANAGINNQIAYVSAKANNQSLSVVPLGSAFVTETPAGTAAQVRASTVTNASQFKSLYFQQKYSATLFLRYPGCYVSGMTLSGGVGQFINGTFTMLAQQESSSAADASTGAVLAAPTGSVNDPVGAFGGLYIDRVAVGSVLNSFSINVAMQGAALEYGMGSAVAAGVVMGVLQATGTVQAYFKDFTLYTRFTAETQGMISIVTKDAAGNAYVITLHNAALMNARIDAGGPGQPVMASFDLEGNPGTTALTPGTVRIDRLPAT